MGRQATSAVLPVRPAQVADRDAQVSRLETSLAEAAASAQLPPPPAPAPAPGGERRSTSSSGGRPPSTGGSPVPGQRLRERAALLPGLAEAPEQLLSELEESQAALEEARQMANVLLICASGEEDAAQVQARVQAQVQGQGLGQGLLAALEELAGVLQLQQQQQRSAEGAARQEAAAGLASGSGQDQGQRDDSLPGTPGGEEEGAAGEEAAVDVPQLRRQLQDLGGQLQDAVAARQAAAEQLADLQKERKRLDKQVGLRGSDRGLLFWGGGGGGHAQSECMLWHACEGNEEVCWPLCHVQKLHSQLHMP